MPLANSGRIFGLGWRAQPPFQGSWQRQEHQGNPQMRSPWASSWLPIMRLTARDLEVVAAVHDCQVLRRDQIQQLLFPSKNTANEPLKRLFQHGYLARRWLAVEYGQGSDQALHLLASKPPCCSRRTDHA